MAAGILVYAGVRAAVYAGELAAVAVHPDPVHNVEFGDGPARPDLAGPLMAILTVAVLVVFEVALAAIQVRDLIRDVRERRARRRLTPDHRRPRAVR